MMRKRVYGGRSRSQSKTRKRLKTTPSIPRKINLAVPTLSAIRDVQRVKMIYADQLVFNTGLGTPYLTQVFCINGLYDPDITGVGHQPVGYDQYMTLYHRYTVVNARVKVMLSPEANVVVRTGGTWGITFTGPTSSGPADWKEYIENGNCKWARVGPDHSETRELVYNVDLVKETGCEVLQRTEFDGVTSANPTSPQHCHIWFRADGAQDTGDFAYTVEISFDVVFRKNKIAPLS